MTSNKILTLRRRSEFLYLKDKGKRIYAGPWLLLNYIENKKQNHRFGWTIPVKVGSAVLRNKFKRWCRDYCRNKIVRINASKKFYDVNVIIRVSRNVELKELSHKEFQASLAKAFEQIR